jgi:hypothetical protein
MEAAMRSTHFVSFVAATALIVGTSARADAQINFAGSTLRVAPEDGLQVNATEQSAIPAQPPQQFEEPAVMQPLPQPDPAPTPPLGVQQLAFQQRAARGVQQASYNAPSPSISRTLVHAPAGRASTVVHGSSYAQANMSRLPRSAAAQSNAGAVPRNLRGKPFQGMVNQSSGVTPYLSLYNTRGGDGNMSLNYFTAVQPQLQQQEAVRQQAIELRRLQNQVQSMQAGGTAAPNAVHARFMDTGGYYQNGR